MPFENEHACRIASPGLFKEDSFRRIKRDKLSIIVARKKGEDTLSTQAFRYPITAWRESEARTHCKEQEGSFEAAAKGENTMNQKLCGMIFESKRFTIGQAEDWLDQHSIDVDPGKFKDTKDKGRIKYGMDGDIPDDATTSPAGLGVWYAHKKEHAEAEKKDGLETVDIPGVEIFMEGTWTDGNGNTASFTADDMRQTAADSNALFGHLDPPLKIGHNKKQKLAKDEFPSLGFLRNFREKAGKLICDLKGVPKVIANLIAAGAYGKLSVEFFENYFDESAQKKFKRVVCGAALLGGTLPALGSLKEIMALYGMEPVPEATSFLFSIGDNGIEPFEIKANSEGGDNDMALEEDVKKLTEKVSTFEKVKADSDAKLAELKAEKAELEKDAKEKSEKVEKFEKAEKARAEDADKAAAKDRSDFMHENAKRVEPKHQPMFLALLEGSETSKSTFSMGEGDEKKEFKVADQLREYIKGLPDDAFDEHGKIKKKDDDAADKDDVDKEMEVIAKKHNLDLSKDEDYEKAFDMVLYKKPASLAAEDKDE